MSIRNRIGRLEKAAGQSSRLCRCPRQNNAEWPDDLSAWAEEMLHACRNCGKPKTPLNTDPLEVNDKLNVIYGGAAV